MEKNPLNRSMLNIERHFFKTNGERREVYRIVSKNGENGNYIFSYITLKGERKTENLTKHLSDEYIGGINEMIHAIQGMF